MFNSSRQPKRPCQEYTISNIKITCASVSTCTNKTFSKVISLFFLLLAPTYHFMEENVHAKQLQFQVYILALTLPFFPVSLSAYFLFRTFLKILFKRPNSKSSLHQEIPSADEIRSRAPREAGPPPARAHGAPLPGNPALPLYVTRAPPNQEPRLRRRQSCKGRARAGGSLGPAPGAPPPRDRGRGAAPGAMPGGKGKVPAAGREEKGPGRTGMLAQPLCRAEPWRSLRSSGRPRRAPRPAAPPGPAAGRGGRWWRWQSGSRAVPSLPFDIRLPGDPGVGNPPRWSAGREHGPIPAFWRCARLRNTDSEIHRGTAAPRAAGSSACLHGTRGKVQGE